MPGHRSSPPPLVSSLTHHCSSLLPNFLSGHTPWKNGKEVPRWGVAEIQNQLEKLEAAKAACLVCLSLLSLLGPSWSFWVNFF